MKDRQIPQERLDLLWILAYAAALLFILRLVNLQVLGGAHYREIAEKNRTQIIAQAAPRGRIFSADEVALVTSKPSFSLIYFPGQAKTVSTITEPDSSVPSSRPTTVRTGISALRIP